MSMLFRKFIKNRTKAIASKMGAPFTSITNEREIRESAPDLNKTVGTIYRLDIVARGFFSKKRSLVINKLFFCPISRYFIFKFYNFSFRFAKFILGGCMSFFHYVHLFVNESDPFSENFVALNARKCSKRVFDAVNPESKIHNEKPKMNDDEIMNGLGSKSNKKHKKRKWVKK